MIPRKSNYALKSRTGPETAFNIIIMEERTLFPNDE